MYDSYKKRVRQTHELNEQKRKYRERKVFVHVLRHAGVYLNRLSYK